MFDTIVGALAPIFIALVLGYSSAWRGIFTRDHASAMIRMVLTFALPLSLFVGIADIPRDNLIESGGMLFLISGSMILSAIITFIVAHYCCGRSLTMSGLQILAIANPSVPFIGTAVLGYLFSTQSALPIALSSITLNLIILPASLIIISLDKGHNDQRPWYLNILSTLKKPVIILPAIAIILVLCGIHVPAILNHSFSLIGETTGGIGLFAAGILLYFSPPIINLPIISSVIARNLVIPAAVFLMTLWINIPHFYAFESVVALSIPTASIVVVVANQIGVGEREANSTMFISTVASLVTMAGFIGLMSLRL